MVASTCVRSCRQSSTLVPKLTPTPLRGFQSIRPITSLGKSQGRLVILGSGWAGFKLLRGIDTRQYEVIVVSPRNYFVFTPLLAGTAVGTLEFRCVVEPVRNFTQQIQFYQAYADSIDFEKKEIKCTSNLEDTKEQFSLGFDKLVIAPGAQSNTFGIQGVNENAFFLKDIADAKKIRRRVIECFEHASQPYATEQEQIQLLHFQIVGGGPTGIELAAELHDFIMEDLSKLYPALMPKVQMTVYDVAKRILGSFDQSLADYAQKRFMRRGIKIRTGTRVAEVDKGKIVLADGSEVPYGMLVWATGLTQIPLIQSLDSALSKDKSKRIVTDDCLRVFDKAGNVMDNVYALGDCATIKEHDLPATAQVANQKAVYLYKQLNKKAHNPDYQPQPFTYVHRGAMAYVGGWRAVVDFSEEVKNKGPFAWFFWRSAYLTYSVSWKNKMLIPMYWLLTFMFGRSYVRL